MYCENCGNKLTENSQYCTKCGHKKNVIETTTAPPKEGDGKRTASIVLGILSLAGVVLLIFSPISLILGLIGLILAIKANKTTNNTVGIVLNAIGLFFSVIIVAVLALLIYLTYGIVRTGPVDYGHIIENYITEYQNNDHNF